MKVELSIKDDKELRNTIKDMIRGQVKAIIREDLQAMIIESIAESSYSRLEVTDTQVEEALYLAVRNSLPTSLGAVARELLETRADKLANKMVDQVFAKKLDTVLNSKFDDDLGRLLEKRVRDYDIKLVVS